MHYQEPRIQHRGHRLYVREYSGEGPAIVLMHGFPDNLHLYDRLLLHLVPTRRAAKASLHGLTRTLMKELGPDGILTNVVMPGLTLTERNANVLPDALREELEQESPIRRLLPPEEVAPTIVFLCSAANTAVTGEVIRASGGIT